jgi:hypothetical protein
MAAKLSITITGGNDAMQTSEDFADLLRKVSFTLEEAQVLELVSFQGCSPIRKTLSDDNGNIVGLLTITEE